MSIFCEHITNFFIAFLFSCYLHFQDAATASDNAVAALGQVLMEQGGGGIVIRGTLFYCYKRDVIFLL